MPQNALTNAFFLINAVDLSDHVEGMDFKQIVDQLEATAMGATTKITKPGLLDGSLVIDLWQDFATGKVDQTVSPLLGVNSATPTPAIEIRPTILARSLTNPAYTFNGSISNYNPISGKVTDTTMQKCQLTIQFASAVSRLTA